MECLRGRLLAERHASRVAKENADLLANKVCMPPSITLYDFPLITVCNCIIENVCLTCMLSSLIYSQMCLEVQLIDLENHLKEETKLRNKAEKKLEVLMKKLNSLNISAISVEPELSSSSEKFQMSCTSSTSTSDSKDPKVDESKSQFTTPVISQNLEHNVSEDTKTDSCPQGTASSKYNSNLNDPIQQRDSDESSSNSEDPKTDNHRYSIQICEVLANSLCLSLSANHI